MEATPEVKLLVKRQVANDMGNVCVLSLIVLNLKQRKKSHKILHGRDNGE